MFNIPFHRSLSSLLFLHLFYIFIELNTLKMQKGNSGNKILSKKKLKEIPSKLGLTRAGFIITVINSH